MSMWSRAKDVAARTPESRNRYVDFLRAASITVVVLGHWTVAAAYISDGELILTDMLHIAPWTQWLTWALQVMPIFFIVGGYSNGIFLGIGTSRQPRLWILAFDEAAPAHQPDRAASHRLGRSGDARGTRGRVTRKDRAGLTSRAHPHVVSRRLHHGRDHGTRDALALAPLWDDVLLDVRARRHHRRHRCFHGRHGRHGGPLWPSFSQLRVRVARCAPGGLRVARGKDGWPRTSAVVGCRRARLSDFSRDRALLSHQHDYRSWRSRFEFASARHTVWPIVALQRRVRFSAPLARFCRIRWHQRRARRAEQASFSVFVSNLDFRVPS